MKRLILVVLLFTVVAVVGFSYEWFAGWEANAPDTKYELDRQFVIGASIGVVAYLLNTAVYVATQPDESGDTYVSTWQRVEPVNALTKAVDAGLLFYFLATTVRYYVLSDLY